MVAVGRVLLPFCVVATISPVSFNLNGYHSSFLDLLPLVLESFLPDFVTHLGRGLPFHLWPPE